MKQYRDIKGIVFCLICFIFVGILVFTQLIQIQNIFDQMYYTRVRTSYSWWGVGNSITSFENMPQIKQISRDTEGYYTAEGYFENDYKDEHLGEGESLAIVFECNEKTMEIIGVKRFTEFKIIYRYTYDIKTKQLHETVECLYGELYSGEFNEYREEFRERTKNPQEILLVIEEAGLTKEDLIKYKQYFLYDKLLTDWLDANLSRFSAKRWGRIEYIEVLPLETGK